MGGSSSGKKGGEIRRKVRRVSKKREVRSEINNGEARREKKGSKEGK